jgi:electron transport complex protein RnfC
MKTFRIGGVHPAENKLSAAEPIIKAELPKVAVYPMGQHIGAPAKPIVQKGDKVKVGTMIAEAGGFVSAPIFSGVSGTVLKVDTVIDASGYAKPAVYITVEGDEWEEGIDRSEKLVTLKEKPELTPEVIVDKIKAAGIVGMGGACFPTHVKLCPPPGNTPQWVIINAVECEPYLTADHRLMLEKADQVLVGVDLLMKAGKVSKGFIGIEENKPDAIKLLSEKCAANYPNIEVVPLKTKYPQGGEKQLIDAVVRRQVPAPPALPVSVGAIVQNVGTAYAVYEAVMKNKPLFERVVTVTGKSLKYPRNFLARMGTPMSQLIDACGGLPEDTGKVIGGGPMMGKALVNIEVPICKGSSGVLIMNEKEARRGEEKTCIRCAKCVGACPMGLEPYLLATASAKQMWDKCLAEGIPSCIECGSCQFTCPSNRPLLDYIRVGKTTVIGIIHARKIAEGTKKNI